MKSNKTLILFTVCCLALSIITGCAEISSKDKPVSDKAVSEPSVNYLRIFNNGNQYYNSRESRDFEKAFDSFKTAAENGIPEAYEFLGFMYYLGIGTEKDLQNSETWFKKAISEGFVNAEYCLNNVLFSYSEAFSYYLPEGAADAFRDGFKYYYGIEKKQDYEKAFSCFKMASELYNPYGYYGMALCYLHGNYVSASLPDCLQCLEAASSYNCVAADFKLYQMYSGYYDGIEDRENAEVYFNRIKDYTLNAISKGYDELVFSDEFINIVNTVEDRNTALQIIAELISDYEWNEDFSLLVNSLLSENIEFNGSIFSGNESSIYIKQIEYYINNYVLRSNCEESELIDRQIEKYGFFNDDVFNSINLNTNYWLLFKDNTGAEKTAIVHIPLFKTGEAAEVIDRIDGKVLFRTYLENRSSVSAITDSLIKTSLDKNINEIIGIYELDNTLSLMLDMGFPEEYILFWMFSDYAYLFSGNNTSYSHSMTYAELADIFTDLIPPEFIYNSELID